ncbi:MAG: cytochrome P460 family protein [Candidatus Sulfotelmatobacter sp.]
MPRLEVDLCGPGGWGFAQFKDGKPDHESALKTCFSCHEPVKARDFVFTHYAP